MRTLVVMLATLLLSCAPAQAQTTEPSPSPTTIIHELSDAAAALGTNNFVQVVVVLIQGGIVVFLVTVAQKGFTPLVSTIKTLNDTRDELQDALFKRLEVGDKERARVAEVNERTVTILEGLETRGEARSGRHDAVNEINQHVDRAHAETRESLKPIEDKLEHVIQMLNDEEQRHVQRDKALNVTLSSVTKELVELRQAVKNLTDRRPSPDIGQPLTEP